jgi:hypothetical protein
VATQDHGTRPIPEADRCLAADDEGGKAWGQKARRTPRLGVEETGTGGRVPHTHGPDKSEGFQVARGATAGAGHLAEVVRWVVSKESLTYETGDLKTLDG